MGLTLALNTSLNGLSLNETDINVLGNNIANAGTTGFKSSYVSFATQLANTVSFGSAPSATDGGTNPRQIGLGASVAAISADFSQGSITASSSPSDLAIQGDGFFVLNQSGAGQVYSRAGNFTLDSANELTNTSGQQVLGYGIDNSFNRVTTGLTKLSIPLGSLHLAQQTNNITMGGALSPQGIIATQGTLQTSEALVDNSGNAPVTATANTLLVSLATAALPATNLYQSGDVLKFAPTKGGQTMGSKSLTITGATTVADLETFFSNSLGLQTGGGIPVDADAIPVGVSIVGGQILVKGNRGTVDDFTIPIGSMTINGAAVPISFTPTSVADGGSATTTFTVYDSLGTPLNMRMTAYLESQVSNKTTYRYLLESADQSGPSIAIGNGTIDFDNQGHVSSTATAQFAINRSATSATNPMLVTLDVSSISGISSTGSNLNLVSQDGTSPGTLTSYVIDEKGVINGAFDNGITRTLGQVVLARFPNPQGLVQIGSNNYSQGIASGLPALSAPGNFGAGTLRAGALEQSNTDIGKNLVNLIVASTNYQGNARVISSVDQLVNVLLTLGR
ncbi:MAG: flagellar hook-basal body complex protein [Planctomycetia bacterium]|nr:flagellar hook-basal body complex protein [Planctomycetia bacterium]